METWRINLHLYTFILICQTFQLVFSPATFSFFYYICSSVLDFENFDSY